MRSALLLLLVLLPSSIKIPIYRKVFNYKIGRDVTIGLSYIRVGQLAIGDHVRIGHLNIFSGVRAVSIGSFSIIGRCNWFYTGEEFSCAASIRERGNTPEIIIGDHCGIANDHHFDVEDRITIGDYTTIAGERSLFFTHQLDMRQSKQSTKPIAIGKYCMLGSNVSLGPGATIPDNCFVSLGSVVLRQSYEPHSLISGNPAVATRSLPEGA